MFSPSFYKILSKTLKNSISYFASNCKKAAFYFLYFPRGYVIKNSTAAVSTMVAPAEVSP